MAHGGSQSSGAHFLAGMMKTSTCVLHVTDREGGSRNSTCVSQLTVREGLCRGSSSGPDGRPELRMQRDESPDKPWLLCPRSKKSNLLAPLPFKKRLVAYNPVTTSGCPRPPVHVLKDWS